MNLPEDYVDGFGITYPNGIVIPTDINITSQNNRFLRYTNDGYDTVQNNKFGQVSFRAISFVSATAKELGKRPINFVTPEGQEYFTVEVEFENLPKTDADAVLLCEAYLTSILGA